MSLLLRAIVTGFGLKVGVELARYVTAVVQKVRARSRKADDDDDGGELPDGASLDMVSRE
jgi:hypothetical protein